LRIIEHATEWIACYTIGTGFCFDSSGDGIQTRLGLGIAWFELESFVKGIFCADKVSKAMFSSTFATPTFRPIWLQFGCLVSILESFLVIF